MILPVLFLLSVDLLNVNSKPIVADVSIGSAGPYRFLIDTGAETSTIDPELAFHLDLEPQFQVEIQTEHSSYMAPALNVATLKLGRTSLPLTELVLHRVNEAKKLDSEIKGTLGMNAFHHRDFTLWPGTGSLTITRQRPQGEAVPFVWSGNRITLKATMGNETLRLVLDSGSNHVVFFRIPAAMQDVSANSATMRTTDGARSIVPTHWTGRINLAESMQLETLPAALVLNSQAQIDGLMPVSPFRAIHVDQTRSELVLQR